MDKRCQWNGGRSSRTSTAQSRRPPLKAGVYGRWMTLGHRAHARSQFAAKRKSTASRFATTSNIALRSANARGIWRGPRLRFRHWHDLHRIRRHRPRSQGGDGEDRAPRRSHLSRDARPEGSPPPEPRPPASASTSAPTTPPPRTPPISPPPAIRSRSTTRTLLARVADADEERSVRSPSTCGRRRRTNATRGRTSALPPRQAPALQGQRPRRRFAWAQRGRR